MLNLNTEQNTDAEIVISRGGYGARVAPHGASLRGFWKELPNGSALDIITGYSGAAHKVGGQGDVLVPFPGRIKGGRYTFEGVDYELELSDKEGPNAIHGFLRAATWSITDQRADQVSFAARLGAADHQGYPFSLKAEVCYSLDDAGLTCRYSITNTGDRTAPIAAGFHPYFSVGDGLIDNWSLELPMAQMLEFENLVPTGRVLDVRNTEFDFRSMRRIGSTQLNTCFLRPIRDNDRRMVVRLTAPEGAAIEMWADESLDYLVLYSGDPLPESHRRRSLAIEPMTCGSDGFNHPEWGLISLAARETASGSWGARSRE